MNIRLHSKGILYCDWDKINQYRLELIENMKKMKSFPSIFQLLNLAYISQNDSRTLIMPKEDDNVSSRTEGKN